MQHCADSMDPQRPPVVTVIFPVIRALDYSCLTKYYYF